MSTGAILICEDCREAVYIGTSNTYIVEDHETVGVFLWMHQGHRFYMMPESNGCYGSWKALNSLDDIKAAHPDPDTIEMLGHVLDMRARLREARKEPRQP